MATENDSGGLVDRRSLRELLETSVGGSRAPMNARSQLANTREARRRLEKEVKRLKKLKAKARKKMMKSTQ